MKEEDKNTQSCEEKPIGDAIEEMDQDIDWNAYEPYLDGMQLTEQQKREFLETLYSIMRSIVELGFSVDLCAQLLELPNENPDDSPTDVKSKKSSEKVVSTNGSTKEKLR